MSSAQELFRQKRAEKGGAAKPNWKELKAKKLQQQQQQKVSAAAAAAAPAPAPVPAPRPAAPAAPLAPSSKGLPADFFQALPSGNAVKKPGSQQPPPASKAAASNLPSSFFQPPKAPSQPAPAAPKSGTSGPGLTPPVAKPSHPPAPPSAAPSQIDPSLPGAHVPKGFFADVEADAKVRGEKLPTKEDKEQEFKDFQKMMEEEVKVAAQVEAEEAEAAAEERRSREEFEQMARLMVVEELRIRRKGAGREKEGEIDKDQLAIFFGRKAAGRENEGERDKDELAVLFEPDSKPDLFDLPLPVAKRRRVIDVLKEELEESSGDESDGGEELEAELLDWRAKTV